MTTTVTLTDAESTFWQEPHGGSGRGYIQYDVLVCVLEAQGFTVVDNNQKREDKVVRPNVSPV